MDQRDNDKSKSLDEIKESKKKKKVYLVLEQFAISAGK